MKAPKRKTAHPTKILVVDDHPLVREHLGTVINREPDLTVCGEAEDCRGALAAIAATKPDLAIIDLTLKDSHGLDLLKDIQIQYPKLRTLVVSMHDESLYAERVMRAGANGFITKQHATRDILKAIRQVLSGQCYLSSQMTSRVISKFSGHARKDVSDIEQLTDRELQVLELIGRGLTTRRVAEQLVLDIKTIDTYRARLKDKLGLKDGAQLVQRAVQWLELSDK